MMTNHEPILTRDYSAYARNLLDRLLSFVPADSALISQAIEFLGQAQGYERHPRRSGIHALNLENFRLRSVADDLECLKGRHPSTLSALCSKLSQATPENLYGYRHELRLAAALTRRDVPYSMPDPPDFVVGSDGASVNVECVSLHSAVPGRGLRHARAKIEARMQEKGGYAYAGPNCVLAIDVANLQANCSPDRHLLQTPESLPDYLATVNGGLKPRFGAVLAITCNYLPEGPALESGFVHYIDGSASPAVRKFVTDVFPQRRGGYVLRNAIPIARP